MTTFYQTILRIIKLYCSSTAHPTLAETFAFSAEIVAGCGQCHMHGSGDSPRSAHCMKDRANNYVVTKDGTKLLREHGYILKTRYKD